MRIGFPPVPPPPGNDTPAIAASPGNHQSPREPLVTVVMATRNRPKLLKVAMASVMNQTYRNWELVLVNDGGEDVRYLVEGAADPRIRYFHLPENLGAAHAYNYSISESVGEYITYLADDDLYYPNHIQVLVEALEDNPGKGGAYSRQYEVQCTLENGEYTAIHEKFVRFHHEWMKLSMIARGNFIPQPCVMHRRSLFAKAGMFDESLAALIDYDLFRRMAFYTDFIHVPVITGEYFFPRNKQERITDLQNTDPERYFASSSKAFGKVPEKPWDRMETLSIFIHCRMLGEATLKQLKFLFTEFIYPMKVYIFLDGYNRESLSLFKALDGVPAQTILSIEPVGMEGAIRKFLGSHMDGGWLTILDEATVADREWRKTVLEQVHLQILGQFAQLDTLAPFRLYTNPRAVFPFPGP